MNKPRVFPDVTTDPHCFLIIDFSSSNFDPTATKQSEVTLTLAHLDGRNILSSFNTQDHLVFLYRASNLSLGKHSLRINAKDRNGIELGQVIHVFEVNPMELFEIKLTPGWNLISLPNYAADPDINAVIDASNRVNTVITYDPADLKNGPWLTAVRSTNGKLVGSLKQISGGRGYWIQTSDAQPLKVNLPGISGGQQITPPMLGLQKGWNLMPVMDITGAKKCGDALDFTAAEYLGGFQISHIYEYDSPSGHLKRVASSDRLKVGSGYWVNVTSIGSQKVSPTVENHFVETQEAHNKQHPNRIFVVHGSDHRRHEVARFLEKGAAQTIMLEEEPPGGLTLIEKLEKYSNVSYAVVLMTPDDLGGARSLLDKRLPWPLSRLLSQTDLKPRSRQNVILELGFFHGLLGRRNLCILRAQGIEIPSDFDGFNYIPLDANGGWKFALQRELSEAGIPFNINKAVPASPRQ